MVFAKNFDLNEFLPLLSKAIEASNYTVDVTNKHVAIYNKALRVVAINNKGKKNKKCAVVAFRNVANNAYQLVCKTLQKM